MTSAPRQKKRAPRGGAPDKSPAKKGQPAAKRRRSAGQRLVLGVGLVLSLVATTVAVVAGWAAWRYMSVDRVDVKLDSAAAGGPENYLIVGSDSRSGGDPDNPGKTAESRAPLADTIMVIRIDPSTRSGRMLSIPRDLWVTGPDGTQGRINATYAKGPQGLLDTVRSELNLPINHYAEVDFQAFAEIVGAVDGVPMYFDRAMKDANSGLDISEPGCVVLDGNQALGFARARHLRYLDPETGRFRYDGTGDLGRQSRQQVFIRRLITRATDRASSNPLVGQRVLDAALKHVTLDRSLGLADLKELAERFKAFDSQALGAASLPVTPRVTDGGAQVLDLDVVAAEPILAQFRDPVSQSSTSSTAVADDPVSVAVYNSSGITGLAKEVSDALSDANYQVVETGNGDVVDHSYETQSLIRFQAGQEPAARSLAQRLGISDVAVASAKESSLAPVVLVLGVDDAELVKTAAAGDAGSSGASTTSRPGTSGTSEGTTTSSPAIGSASRTTTTVVETPVIGVIPGDPPPGVKCG